jgi:hypothetical protein
MYHSALGAHEQTRTFVSANHETSIRCYALQAAAQ